MLLITSVLYLNIKSCFLQVSNQGQAPTDRVGFALSTHLLCGFVQVFEAFRLQVAGNALTFTYTTR